MWSKLSHNLTKHLVKGVVKAAYEEGTSAPASPVAQAQVQVHQLKVVPPVAPSPVAQTQAESDSGKPARQKVKQGSGSYKRSYSGSTSSDAKRVKFAFKVIFNPGSVPS